MEVEARPSYARSVVGDSINEDWATFQHADGRWIALGWLYKRVDRTEGRRGAADAHLFRSFATPALALAAFTLACRRYARRGFERVEKIEGFVPVPMAQWREEGPSVGVARNSPLRATAYPKTIATLMRGIDQRLQLLSQTAKVEVVWNAPALRDDLARVERRLTRPLPPSFRAFYLRHDGCRIVWSSRGQTVRFTLPPAKQIKIVERDGWRVLSLADGLGIAFGEKPRGECCVVTTAKGGLEVVAPSFGHFLEKASKRHFA